MTKQRQNIEAISDIVRIQTSSTPKSTSNGGHLHQTITEIFEEQVRRTPNVVAVVYGGSQLTYQELNRRSNQLGHYLAVLGVRPGDRVGICIERSLEMVVGLLGILKAGAAYVPLDRNYPQERLQVMANDTEIKALLVQQKPVHTAAFSSISLVVLNDEQQKIEEQSAQT